MGCTEEIQRDKDGGNNSNTILNKINKKPREFMEKQMNNGDDRTLRAN
jgi:hypothetical protein